MVCYHPIKVIDTGLKTIEGKKRYKFLNIDEVYKLEKLGKGDLIEELPCGKCVGCRIDKSKDWANRMQLELMYHDCASFVTLTYDNENVPVSHYVDSEGIEKRSLSLRKTDLQKFMKRLRKHFSDKKIRFFACGEYGSKTLRPHYHLILFGLDFPDKYVYQINSDGNFCFRSETLEKIWPFGFTMINEVNWQTCAYVARYTLKKYSGDHNIYYQTFNIEPEFNLMSRRPGIGRQYYDENKDKIYENQEIFISTPKGGKKISPPRYFDRLYGEENPDGLERIKKERSEHARRRLEIELSKTDLKIDEYLRVKESEFKRRISSLKRSKI